MTCVGRYVCVIEPESSTLGYIHRPQRPPVFERLGCAQIHSTRLAPAVAPAVGPDYFGYTAPLFVTPAATQPR